MSAIKVSDEDVQALMEFIEKGSGEGSQKRKQTMRAILVATAAQASQLRALSLRVQLDEATLESMGKSLQRGITVKKLAKVLNTPTGSVDMDAALRRAARLEDDIDDATTATETFTTIARFAVGAAKLIV
jgi:hypothetical protein